MNYIGNNSMEFQRKMVLVGAVLLNKHFVHEGRAE